MKIALRESHWTTMFIVPICIYLGMLLLCSIVVSLAGCSGTRTRGQLPTQSGQIQQVGVGRQIDIVIAPTSPDADTVAPVLPPPSLYPPSIKEPR